MCVSAGVSAGVAAISPIRKAVAWLISRNSWRLKVCQYGTWRGAIAWQKAFTTRCGPAHTSQDCSQCGWRNPDLILDDRGFICRNPSQPDCHPVLDHDY